MMFLHGIKFFSATALFSCALACHAAYPEKAVRLVVPFSAGTSTDILARQFGLALGGVINQAVIVDNKTGAEGAIGAKEVASIAPPDGYTALFTSNSTVVLDPFLKASLPYDPVRDLAPVCTVARVGNVMNARASLPYNTAAEFIAAAKAQPGKFTFGYSTSNTRLAAELFQQRARVKMLGVPYKSSAAGLADVAGDVVDLFFINPVSVSPFIKGGKVKPLAVGGTQRIKELPQVPTLAEAGVKGYEDVTFIAVYLPGKTPPAIVNQFRTAAEQAIKSQAMASFREKAGYQDLVSCGDEFKAWQSEQINFWRPVIKDANILPE